MLCLKLGSAIKYRLHRGAIHPVMSWGAQANGLAPQRRQQLRVLAGRGLGLQRSGSVDVVLDMHPDKSDPGDSIILQHIHTVWKVLHSMKAESLLDQLELRLGSPSQGQTPLAGRHRPSSSAPSLFAGLRFRHLQRQTLEKDRLLRHS